MGQVPNLAHSLVPGSAGPLPVHNPGTSSVHHVMSDPAVNDPKLASAGGLAPVAASA